MRTHIYVHMLSSFGLRSSRGSACNFHHLSDNYIEVHRLLLCGVHALRNRFFEKRECSKTLTASIVIKPLSV